jgi:folate-dependent phosphoribosylglycinamide formyltransferase PurN
LRIVLLTLESALSAEAVAAFMAGAAGRGVVLVGRSPPFRQGRIAPLRAHLARSGPRFLPYLLANYALPHWVGRRGRGWLARAAARRGVPVLEMPEMNGAAAREALRAARPDLLLTFHCDQILAPETLALARLGGINVHPSLLPAHRGPVPTIHARAETPPRFGVTIHRTAARIDAGAILAQRAVALPERATASAAARALHLAGVPLLEEVLAALAAGGVAERIPPPLPYCPFPAPALLRGLRLVDAADWRAALRCRVG